MSALPLEADVYFRDGHVRFEPTRDIIFAQYVLTVIDLVSGVKIADLPHSG